MCSNCLKYLYTEKKPKEQIQQRFQEDGLKMNEARKEQLRKMSYGDLQRQPEFKRYLETYIYSQSRLFNELEYILKKSYEDNEAPYSWDDVTNLRSIRRDDLINDLVDELEQESEETQKEVFEELNENYDRKIKTVGDFEVFLESLDNEEIEDCIESELCAYTTVNYYDYEEDAEVYQWFIMDDRIIRELNDRGEVTLNGFVWGRQGCGQAIELDSVIIDIFKEWYLELYGLPEFDEVTA